MNEIIYMNGYGSYVWSAYGFTIFSLIFLFYFYYQTLVRKERKLKDLQDKHEQKS